MHNYIEMRNRWLSSQFVSENMKDEITNYSDEAAKAMFSSYMNFGTAGLRAKMGPGIAAMNTFTVAHATAALMKYVSDMGKEAMEAGVAIAYDCRNNSKAFAYRAAEVLTSGGVRVYIYPELRPTPMLSFAVRYLGCAAGVNITASHNPAEYNGYKAYGSDGAQLSPEAAAVVYDYMKNTDIFDGVSEPGLMNNDLLTELDAEIEDAYIQCVLDQRVNPDSSLTPINIVYTPLYGCGLTVVPEVFRRAGYDGVYPLESQMIPNGDFPGIKNPNPEFPEAFTAAIPFADCKNADLIIATDPDADRVGCMSRNKEGNFTCISGNQMGALLIDYIITAYRETNSMPDGPYVVKSLVSTKLAAIIAKRNNVRIFDVPTGFKFIGETIEKQLKLGDGTFIFGFEESYGYLKGNYARDKDAVVASLLIAEMAAYYKKSGMTLLDALDQIYSKYGYYFERVFSVSVSGFDADEKLNAILAKLRAEPPKSIANMSLSEIRDYKSGTIIYDDGRTEETAQPLMNMLYYVLKDESVVIIRPSGTEPKVKVYIMASGNSKESCTAALDMIEADMRTLLE